VTSPPEAAQPVPQASAQVKKRALIDGLLLALKNSEIARIVDLSTLEYFLESSYPDMARGDAFDLSMLWGVLEKEPGIEPSMIYPPMLAFASWERQLGVTVSLPAAIKQLTPEEQRAHLVRSSLTAVDLDRHLAARKPAQPKATAAAATSAPKAAAEPKQKGGLRVSPVVIAVALVVLIGVLGGGVWFALQPAAPDLIKVDGFASAIKLKDGKRHGPSMSAVIDDAGYAGLPVKQREAKVAALLALAKPMGIRSVLLLDANGNLKATARQGGDEPGAADQITVVP
jgi:hypothetical protein